MSEIQGKHVCTQNKRTAGICHSQTKHFCSCNIMCLHETSPVNGSRHSFVVANVDKVQS